MKQLPLPLADTVRRTSRDLQEEANQGRPMKRRASLMRISRMLINAARHGHLTVIREGVSPKVTVTYEGTPEAFRVHIIDRA